jgi:hypothetical protein
MFISGAIPFRNNTERKSLFWELRKEFGEDITIKVENYIMTYYGSVSRDIVYQK